ncbi:hypothetical protein BS78_05G225000 [Paspalum vaginatum]|nr:hypothetical protein BS78_05G225000 [Paspalum vaginatum]
MAVGAWANSKRGVPALGWWLIAVGTFRSAFTSSCLFGAASLCSLTMSGIHMTGVHGRTAGVWTLLYKPLYVATFLSFLYAIAYLAMECLLYRTIRFVSLVPFIFVAGTSMVWMLLQWNSDGGHGRRPREATKQP